MNPEAIIIRRGYRFRLRSNPAAEAKLCRFDGCCRKVWNLALAEQQARRAREEKYASYVAMAKWLTAWRADPATSFLSGVPVHVLQNVLKALDNAFREFFAKRRGYPKFKRYGDPVGLRETDVACFAVDSANGRVKFPKLGWLRYRKSREIVGSPRIVTLSHELDGWYVSVMTCNESPFGVAEGSGAIPCAATAIGAGDRGVTNFLATAAGRLVAPLDAHKTSLHRLRKYQRAVSRRMEAAKVAAGLPKNKPFPKGFKLQRSNRLRQAQARVAKIHQKIARQRADFLHKLSTDVAKNHAVFCLEDLKVQNMSASAAGNTERPGKNVRQKAGLNRSILDQGWATWARMLEYKLAWCRGQLIKVPAAYTSQKCAQCGHIHPGNRNDERFRCRSCGHEDHADVNAAKNILAAGFAVLAGEHPGHAGVEDTVQSGGRPMKRQPTEELAYAA